MSLIRDGPGLGWSHALGSDQRVSLALMYGAPQFDGYQNPGGACGFGALLEYRLESAGLSLQAGALREADGFLGARPQGAFGQARATTTFLGINRVWAPRGDNNWRALASAYLGHTRAQVDGGHLLHDASAIFSSAFSLGVARTSLWQHDDWFGLRLSQPLRAERGKLTFQLPTGRTKYGAVKRQTRQVSLVPTGRNLQAEAAYRIAIAGGALQTSLGLERHPQHDSERGIQLFMRLSFERRF